MKSRIFTAVILSALLLITTASVSAQSAGKDVDLKAPDGTALKATYFAAAKPGPGILLLHMCNSQRKAWNTLAAQLAAAGFHVVTLDYRGYGESGGGPIPDDPAERQRRVDQLWPGDVDAAFAYLLAQPSVDRNRIGAGGGSCGVNQAIQVARRHPEVKTLVLLAGNTNQAGQTFLQQTAWMPLLGSASLDDGGAVEVMRWMMGFSSNPQNRFLEYKTGGHGTQMFAVHKDLEPAIVAWFSEHLVKNPVRPTTAAASVPPGPSAQFWMLLTGPDGAAQALQQLREARSKGAAVKLPPEGVINALGYQHLQDGRVKEAIQVFTLNVEAYPASANVYDSLSDGYVASGQRDLALQFAEKALQLLPTDANLNDQGRALIRESAEGKIRQLRPATAPATKPPAM